MIWLDRRVPRTTARIEWARTDSKMRSWAAGAILRYAMVLFAPACFNPSYAHTACGPNGECPRGLTCSLQLICEAPVPLPDGSVDYPPPIAMTCADIKSHMSDAADGPYTLYLGGNASKPWPAYCAGMANTPHEYLSLTGTNFAQYSSGGNNPGSPGMNVISTYSKVRFDSVTMKVDISDRTFATSTGTLNHMKSGTTVTSMPYAVAMDCVGPGSMTGIAQIDLTGTSFALVGANEFINDGNSSAELIQMPNNQHATINGGGNCGWAGPVNTPLNPFNNNVDSTNGTILQLMYQP